MFRSVRPYLQQAGITEPVVCYQGALVADPVSGAFLLHEPIGLETAREAIVALAEAGLSPNVYVDDELFVARHTDASRRYADFQGLPVTEVGDLVPGSTGHRPSSSRSTIPRASTCSATSSRPVRRRAVRHDVAALLPRARATRRLEGHRARVRRRAARDRAADTVAFGDGENDIELLEWAGYAVAVENANPLLLEHADWVCPGPESEGVAAVIAAFLDSRP